MSSEAAAYEGKGKGRSFDSFSTANDEEIRVQLKLGRWKARTVLLETREEAPFRVWQQVRSPNSASSGRAS